VKFKKGNLKKKDFLVVIVDPSLGLFTFMTKFWEFQSRGFRKENEYRLVVVMAGEK